MNSKKKNFIEKSLELEEKKTPSDKIFSIVSICAGSVAIILLLFALVMFLSMPQDYKHFAWFYLYYPIIVIALAGIICASGQMMRNHYFSTILALAFNALAVLTLIVVSIIQGALHGQVFAFPFYFI